MNEEAPLPSSSDYCSPSPLLLIPILLLSTAFHPLLLKSSSLSPSLLPSFPLTLGLSPIDAVQANMGRRKKFPFLLRSADARFPWQWPYCTQPKTLSFRVGSSDVDVVFKTLNSVYSDAADPQDLWFSTSSSEEGEGFSGGSEEEEECGGGGEYCIENAIRGLRSERLFFEPGETSSILEEAKGGGFRFKESVTLSMESEDPYVDFRRSMEEMVEAHGLKDWESLEELLSWYLRVNVKQNHGYIIGAFVDLLLAFAFASSPSFSTSSSPLSFASSPSSSTTPCLSSSISIEEDNASSLHV